jgi:hypothetical protein
VIALRMPPLRINHALGAAAILFAVLALWPWIVPQSAPSARRAAAPAASAPAPALATLPPLASFSATVDRPLFAPSRRPAASAAEQATGSSTDGRYRLLGIVATGPTKKAFVVDGGRHIEITEGGMLDSWSVKQIGPDRVLLTSPTGDAVLKLKPAPPEAPKSQ